MGDRHPDHRVDGHAPVFVGPSPVDTGLDQQPSGALPLRARIDGKHPEPAVTRAAVLKMGVGLVDVGHRPHDVIISRDRHQYLSTVGHPARGVGKVVAVGATNDPYRIVGLQCQLSYACMLIQANRPYGEGHPGDGTRPVTRLACRGSLESRTPNPGSRGWRGSGIGCAVMQDLVEFAVDIARQAGTLTMQHFRAADLTVDRKGDDSPVTIADRQAELLLRRLINDRFPDDAVVGEEHEDSAGTSGRTWYLDPIDGTKSFVHGVPLFSNLVACDDADGPLVGVINCPALGEATWAGRGIGCFHNDTPALVSTTARLDQAYVMTSGLEWWSAQRRPRLLDAPFTWRTWGDGYGYSLVATGRVDAMVDPGAEVWDLAAIPVILHQAGGVFTGLDGHSKTADGGSALASNGLLHDALLRYFS